jgi:hypothetical protein
VLFFSSTRTPVAAALVPRASDLRDYADLAQRIRSAPTRAAAG